jgi:methionyl-tRNA formyltransferase
MISAIQCVKEIDSGPVYLKKTLSLEGRAEEIYILANQIIEEMIIEILNTNPQPKPQTGDVVRFTRRKPEDGNWGSAGSLDEVYDYIRMLDADGYPPAFVRIGNYKLEFSRASRKVSAVNASVRIIKEKENE